MMTAPNAVRSEAARSAVEQILQTQLPGRESCDRNDVRRYLGRLAKVVCGISQRKSDVTIKWTRMSECVDLLPSVKPARAKLTKDRAVASSRTVHDRGRKT